MLKEYKFQSLISKTPKIRGIKTSEYGESGKYPVIDQGNKFIGGYSDNESVLYKDILPVVVFGDHTLAVKYVDFPFCVGADGTQILKPNEEIIIGKFLYYAILKLNIKSLGYSRHFKVLKESTFYIPEIKDQKRIIAILDKADTLRQNRKQVIALLEDYLNSLFFEMFGDIKARKSNHTWGTIRQFVHAESGKSSKVVLSDSKTDFPIYGGNGINGWAIRPLYDKPVVIAGRVGQQCGVIHFSKGPCWVTDNAIVIQINDTNILNSVYLADAFRHSSLRKTVEHLDLPFINQSILLDSLIPLPKIELQNKYADIVERLENLKEKLIVQSEEMETQFQALMQKAFKGEL
jgi:type I restriction enzyme S subunit